MTPYTFEEIQFLNKPTQEENMFTPKFEIPSYEEAKKATKLRRTGSEILGRCFQRLRKVS
jgi:hypothetical protein